MCPQKCKLFFCNRKYEISKTNKLGEFGGFGPGNKLLRRFGDYKKKSSKHMPWRRLFGPKKHQICIFKKMGPNLSFLAQKTDS